MYFFKMAIIFFLFPFKDRISHELVQTCSVAETALELLIPVPPFPKGWDCRHVPSTTHDNSINIKTGPVWCPARGKLKPETWRKFKASLGRIHNVPGQFELPRVSKAKQSRTVPTKGAGLKFHFLHSV